MGGWGGINNLKNKAARMSFLSHCFSATIFPCHSNEKSNIQIVRTANFSTQRSRMQCSYIKQVIWFTVEIRLGEVVINKVTGTMALMEVSAWTLALWRLICLSRIRRGVSWIDWRLKCCCVNLFSRDETMTNGIVGKQTTVNIDPHSD